MCVGMRNNDLYRRHNIFAGEDVDIEGLLRIPWNIELKLISGASAASSSTSGINMNATTASSNTPFQPVLQNVHPASSSGSTSEYLRVDAFLGMMFNEYLN